jgi:hypothetical protein
VTNAKRRIAWATAALLIALGTVAVIVDRRPGGWDVALYEARLSYFEHVPPLFWPRETFSPEAWKQTPHDGRYRFVKSLLSKNELKGRTPSEVNSLLGGMRADRLSCLDQVGVKDDWCAYPLRTVGFQNLWWELVLEFKNGRVSEVRRVLAFLD